MRFSKWHGLGNDYLLTEREELAVPLTPERVRRICDYHFGVGSDGILEVVSANGAEAEIVIWNPDGSTAELSGNGTRIAARWLARRSGEDAVRIHALRERLRHKLFDALEQVHLNGADDPWRPVLKVVPPCRLSEVNCALQQSRHVCCRDATVIVASIVADTA